VSKENSNKEKGKNPPSGGSNVKKAIEIKKFNDLEGRFLLVRVGTDKDPATEPQIKDIEDKLIKLFKDNNVNCLTFVTHHAVDVVLL